MNRLLTVLFLIIFTLFSANAENVKIIHINDTHSHLDSTKVDDVSTGGMAKAATVIKQLKAENPDALLLHAGDAVQGTIYYNMFKGRSDADVLNPLGFDAMAIGNHEFDDGDAQLASFIGMLNFPVISANIIPAKGNVLDGKFSPYIIKNGIGIIGVTTVKKTKHSSSPSAEINFKDEAKSVQKYVNELKAQGINKIIVLSHEGYKNDIELAKKVTDIDIIVGGDSHTLLGEFKDAAGPYPTVAENKNGDKVCIVQAWEHGKVVGFLIADFDGGKIRACGGKPYLTAVEDDKQTAEIVSKYSSQVQTLKNSVAGVAEEEIIHRRTPAGADPYSGSEVVPIVAQSFFEASKRADFSIQNAGGIRMSIPKGDITVDDVYTMLPFSNTIFEIELYGREVKELLEDQIQSIIDKGSKGGFPYSYGLRYSINGKKPYGERVTDIEIKDKKTGKWMAVQADKLYVAATNSFLAKGKDGYMVFPKVIKARNAGTDTGLGYAETFIEFLQRHKTIKKLPKEEYPIKSYIAP
ncbi:5'-nucleotidase C-terminal domain-containing protein [Seleniivibrio sp.]|uniref:bifunctional metallophosphatase/5'-nucleotidase n=1 Tax=Seleniivibrio sp. TaxID=2898801 RepID=UPI0025D38BA0|nr:5'-nucleotidase C-terminal domain-containing protein [Seleniivibrio sp.]MCD8552587.1 5'-nucleotidase C-terminal domain-containing protein [Seleniivibrio sp.]